MFLFFANLLGQTQEKDAEETKKFKEFITNLKPEDFTKYYKQD